MLILMKFDGKYASCNDMQCYLVFTVDLESYSMLKKAKTIYYGYNSEYKTQRIKRAIGNMK